MSSSTTEIADINSTNDFHTAYSVALSDTFDSADHFLPLESVFSPLDFLTPGLPGLYGSLFHSLLMSCSIRSPLLFSHTFPGGWHPLSCFAVDMFSATTIIMIPKSKSDLSPELQACIRYCLLDISNRSTIDNLNTTGAKMKVIISPTKFVSPKPHLGVCWCKDHRR